jgi:hypothetical protein
MKIIPFFAMYRYYPKANIDTSEPTDITQALNMLLLANKIEDLRIELAAR